MSYAKRIAGIVPTHDPRHVEAVMRVTHHSTLDHLSPEEFAREARVAAQILDVWEREAPNLDLAERLASTYGTVGDMLSRSLRAPFE